MEPYDPTSSIEEQAEQLAQAVALCAADRCVDPSSPRTVIRGERSNPWAAYRPDLGSTRVLTDWLNLSFPFEPSHEAIDRFARLLNNATDGVLGGMTDRLSGLHGYTTSFQFDYGTAMFACGGQRNTAFLSLPGDACALVPDWQRFVELARHQLAGRITRWDGAVDDFAGAHGVDAAAQMYVQGQFNDRGRAPSCSQQGNWLTPDTLGRTFYVGQRKNGKLLRVYEKGKKHGASDSAWVRWEVELHNVDRVVPWDVLLNPAAYVAGAYPCMSWVGEERTRIRTVKSQDAISYSRIKQVCSIAYGPLIELMLKREGSPERVVELLRRDGIPKRLAFTEHYLRNKSDASDL